VKASALRPEYVELMPKVIEEGVLYISKKYSTAVHKCCCGCGQKVVTPLKPTEWSLSVAAGGVSLRPSIGNWSFPCRSHYWIRNNQVVWAGDMSAAEIERGRRLDRAAKQEYFARTGNNQATPINPPSARKPGLWKRLTNWLTSS